MRKTKENGITLIALVVTIIVLLILAGITISLVVGQNGIITRANEAKERQAIATEKEQLEMAQAAVKTIKFSKGDMTAMTAAELNAELAAEGIKATASGANPIVVTFTESNREYEVTDEGETSGSINWDEILDNATTPHPDQTESNDIAIGTDGELVNLDLWRYVNTDDVFYTLHGNPVSGGYENGYIGEYIDGKIIGEVPQYIKAENGEFLPVKSLSSTFEGCRSLTTSPVIPSTVTDMRFTFWRCSSLITVPVIPKGVTNMYGTFRECNSLTIAPTIPSTVIDMAWTFESCTGLTGELVINANPTSYYDCLLETSTSANANLKLTGTSTKLNEILATKSENSNISIK